MRVDLSHLPVNSAGVVGERPGSCAADSLPAGISCGTKSHIAQPLIFKAA